jgi:hypothetical protein
MRDAGPGHAVTYQLYPRIQPLNRITMTGAGRSPRLGDNERFGVR